MDTPTDLLTLCRVKGTDAQYRAWIQRQPSCIAGGFSEWLSDLGEWRNPACHVRRAGKSGTGYKADYSCVPLTQAEHLIQHGKPGELGAWMLSAHGQAHATGDPGADLLQAKAWFDAQVIKYLRLWLRS